MRAEEWPQEADADQGLGIADDHTEDLRTPRMEMPPTQSLGGQVEGDTNNHEGSQS